MATDPDKPYCILIIRGSEPGKTNSLFNLINQQSNIDQIYLYAKDPYEAKNKFSIDKQERKALTILMILELLLNTQIIWIIFMKILKKIIQKSNVKY